MEHGASKTGVSFRGWLAVYRPAVQPIAVLGRLHPVGGGLRHVPDDQVATANWLAVHKIVWTLIVIVVAAVAGAKNGEIGVAFG